MFDKNLQLRFNVYKSFKLLHASTQFFTFYEIASEKT